jgi:hypothetical protein
MNAKEAEFGIMSNIKLPEAERWEIIRHLQRRYQDGAVVASREALKAEVAAQLARLRQKIKTRSACAPHGATSTANLSKSSPTAAKRTFKSYSPSKENAQKAPRRCATRSGCVTTSSRSGSWA